MAIFKPPRLGLAFADELDPIVLAQLSEWQAALDRYFQNVINTLIVGTSAGFKLARGQQTTVTAKDTVNTGLATVAMAVEIGRAHV